MPNSFSTGFSAAFKDEFIIISMIIQPLGRGWREEEVVEYGGRCDIRTLDTVKKMNATNEDA